MNIQDDIFVEYLDQFGMKKDEKIDFEQFCDMLKNNKKLHEDLSEKPKNEEKKNNDNSNDNSSDNNNENKDGKKVLKKLNLKEYKLLR